ncbi:hypothetical protein [Haladaptatus caseinilyticus]|uniref:hypothetical protein n=1 Tax=Haladaptatus caseinilyticus TaxID=2993314 RepID=UPI00224ABD86|nr:hypothetical protein [Haladaptatus caseinilyticus]
MLGSLQQEIDVIARTVEVLEFIDIEQPVGIRRTSAGTNTPEHRIRTSFQILENHELIRSTDDGAVTTELTDEFLAAYDEEVESVRETVLELVNVIDY